MAQVYEKIPSSQLALFSKLKFIQGSNFKKFKEFYLSKYLKGFVVPANTFDNVKGKFPIGFTIWDLSSKNKIKNIACDIYEKNNIKNGEKLFYGRLPKSINKWFTKFQSNTTDYIGLLSNYPPDFQNQSKVFIQIKHTARSGAIRINQNNIIPLSVYFAVRHCIKATWLNDRDQFLYPNDGWQTDKKFQNDCLAFTLFHGQNKITSEAGTNHWIPFTESEVNSREKFESNFMSKYIQGKIKPDETPDVFDAIAEPKTHYIVPLKFSPEAKTVFNAGLELWCYYHAQANCNVNASLYDIRAYFQGRNAKGRMNNKSDNETYTELITNLRNNLKLLAQKIEPKVYEYEFLKK